MKKILFIPNSFAQIEKFLIPIKSLPEDVEYKFIVIDCFKNDNILPEIKRLGLPHLELESMEEKQIQRLLEKESAALVVVGNDDELISRSFISAAKSLGIPSLLIQDGIICQRNYFLPISLDYLPTLFSIYGPVYLLTRSLPNLISGKKRKSTDVYMYGTFAEYVAAWGNFSKRSFVELGANADNIRVTGSPIMDAAASQKKPDRKKIYGKIGADPDKKTILFVPADLPGGRLYTKKEYREMCDAVCNAMRGENDIQMIIKPHPSFHRREPHYFDRYLSSNVFLSMHNPYELLQVTDALVADLSTLIAEAVAFGMPVIVVNFTGRDYPSDPYPRIYIDDGVALLLDDKDRCKEALHSILFDKNLINSIKKRQPAFVQDQLYRLDGKSAERIADFIMELLNKK
jgi:hypothetical protein